MSEANMHAESQNEDATQAAQRCCSSAQHGHACLSQATESSPTTCGGTSSRCPTWAVKNNGESKLAALLKACPSWGRVSARRGQSVVEKVARSEAAEPCM